MFRLQYLTAYQENDLKISPHYTDDWGNELVTLLLLVKISFRNEILLIFPGTLKISDRYAG
jgi:hypothetical protein